MSSNWSKWRDEKETPDDSDSSSSDSDVESKDISKNMKGLDLNRAMGEESMDCASVKMSSTVTMASKQPQWSSSSSPQGAISPQRLFSPSSPQGATSPQRLFSSNSPQGPFSPQRPLLSNSPQGPFSPQRPLLSNSPQGPFSPQGAISPQRLLPSCSPQRLPPSSSPQRLPPSSSPQTTGASITTQQVHAIPLHSQGGREANPIMRENHYYDHLYAFELPFECALLPDFKIVNVGATINLGKRFSERYRYGLNQKLRNGGEIECLKSFCIKKVDASTTTETFTRRAKRESEFIFAVEMKMPPCEDVCNNPDRKNAEYCVRNVLGIPVPTTFTDQVMRLVEDRDKLKRCGLTEWVLTNQRIIDKVRRQFKAGALDECWESWEEFGCKLAAIKGGSLNNIGVHIRTDENKAPLSLWLPYKI